MTEVTVYECVACECRGPTPDRVRHLLICPDRDEVRELRFPLGGGPTDPLF